MQAIPAGDRVGEGHKKYQGREKSVSDDFRGNQSREPKIGERKAERRNENENQGYDDKEPGYGST